MESLCSLLTSSAWSTGTRIDNATGDCIPFETRVFVIQILGILVTLARNRQMITYPMAESVMCNRLRVLQRWFECYWISTRMNSPERFTRS